jgi:hypothetical protein
LRCTSPPRCTSASSRWPGPRRRRRSWCCRPPWRCCCRGSARERTSRSAPRWPGAPTRRWTAWSGSS